MATAVAEVLLTASVPAAGVEKTKSVSGSTSSPAEGEVGQLQKWDLATGLGLGAPLKEFYFPEAGPCLVAPFPASPSPSTGDAPVLVAAGIASANRKTGALNYYLPGKERPVHRFFGQDPPSALLVTPDGRSLVTGGERGRLAIWDIATGELIAVLEEAHFQRITVLRASLDAAILVSGSRDGTVKIWSWAQLMAGSREAEMVLAAHAGAVEDVFLGFGLGHNCRLLTAGADQTVRLFDLVDGQLLATLSFPVAIERVLMDCAETTVVAGGRDGCLYLVDLAADPQEIQERTTLVYDGEGAEATTTLSPGRYQLSGHAAAVTGIALSMDETLLVSGDREGNVIIWNLGSRQIIRRIRTEGQLLWLGLITKASLHVEMGVGRARLIVGQPQRTLTGSTPENRPLLCRPRAPPASIGMAPGTTEAPPAPEALPSLSGEQLRRSYAKLVDFVFSQQL